MATFNEPFQSAPTLLLTTVSLLFTGELLDHVSVSTPLCARHSTNARTALASHAHHW